MPAPAQCVWVFTDLFFPILIYLLLFLHFGKGEDDDTLDDRSLVLVYRREGIVGIDEVYFLASTCEDAKVCVYCDFRA